MSRMKLITLTLALLATLLVFTACGNPISEIVHGDPPQGEISQDPAPVSPEPEPEPEETEEQRRARLIKKMEDIFAAAEPMENYTFTLNDPVTVEGREYYYGVWQRVITDYDTQSRYLSTVAEFFITPDGDECYIGNHFPANEGNGETVVFSSGNIFEEINNGCILSPALWQGIFFASASVFLLLLLTLVQGPSTDPQGRRRFASPWGRPCPCTLLPVFSPLRVLLPSAAR